MTTYNMRFIGHHEEMWQTMTAFMTHVPPSMQSMYQTETWHHVVSHALGSNATRVVVLEKDGVEVMAACVYMYPLPLGKYWMYIPRGPVVHASYQQEFDVLLQVFLQRLQKEAPRGLVWVRFDPLREEIHVPNVRVAHKSFHPPATLVIDLHASPEEILAQMKEKGRYNMRLAQKKGVKICGFQYVQGEWKQVIGDTSVELPLHEYVKIMRETTARDGFSMHSEGYLKHFLQTFGRKGLLILALYDEKVIAGGIFCHDDHVFYYYFGASSNAFRNLMAPYLVQWTAMLYAKEHTRCATYDFLGIAEDPQNEKDPLFGVTSFKTKFGGHVVLTCGTYEFVTNKYLYTFIRFVKWTLQHFR